MLKTKTILLLCATFLINSCSFLQEKSETEITNDAVPPKDYNPTFIYTSIPFSGKEKAPGIELSQIISHEPMKIKVRVHLTDSNKYYLSDAAGKGFKKNWCGFFDEFNGKSKEINNYILRESDAEEQTIAVAFVLDHSGSMGQWRANEVQKAIGALIEKKYPRDYYSIIKYDNHIVTELKATQNQNELKTGFQKNGLENYGGMTAISNGIIEGINSLDAVPAGITKAVVVFTDGFDNSSTVQKDSVIKLAIIKNVSINAVDFCDGINYGYMNQFALASGGVYRHIYRTEEFPKMFDDIYFRLRTYYQIEYRPEEFGIHTLTLKFCYPDTTIIAIANYNNLPDIGTVCLLPVVFEFDKANLSKESNPILDNFFVLMKSYPNMEVELRGHTDNVNNSPDEEYNMRLSQRRADAVKKYLVNKGISAARISSKGFGEKQPIADNKLDEGRAQNRRTEFIILKK
ncbi:MAG: OmpA family protein [Candidatus Kapabacteria bacterium]|nr:OmpA family protein [Candidatus Kapabacteria bacterium]